MNATSFWVIITWFFISMCFLQAGLRQLDAKYEGIILIFVGCVSLMITTVGIIKRIRDDIDEFRR